MKFYLYRSKQKIDMLYRQLERPDKAKRIKWKIDLKVISRESETEDDENDIDDKLEEVLKRLDEYGQIGTLADDLPYVRATLPMRWGIYDDAGVRDTATGVLVYFGYTGDDVLFGMAGSSFNVEGMYGITSTSSRSATPYVVDFLLRGMDSGECPREYSDHTDGQTQRLYEGIALANHFLRGPEQNLEFVAKVISRDPDCHVRSWRDERGCGILATPLYVAQTTAMVVDDDGHADQLGKR